MCTSESLSWSEWFEYDLRDVEDGDHLREVRCLVEWKEEGNYGRYIELVNPGARVSVSLWSVPRTEGFCQDIGTHT